MAEDNDLDSLLNLLSEVTNKVEEPPKTSKILQEISIFKPETVDTPTAENIENLHLPEFDSSDDEELRNHESNYNSYGKEIKTILNTEKTNKEPSFSFDRNKRELTWNSKPSVIKTDNASYDPVFGIRIVNPLVSSNVIKERMNGRTPISLYQLKYFIQNEKYKETDWVIGGVIVCKSDIKTSQKGNQYMIWTLSDLKDELKTVAVFLFKNAYKNLWKTPKGAVVAILNPSVLDQRDGSKDEGVVSVDNSDRVMLLGQGKDLGYCKSMKKNGDKCNAFINAKNCEFCIYHIKQEYHKFAKRTELQSPTAGRGLVNLRNKVLGKNEVFYAGKSFMAIKVNNRKLRQKDEGTLQALSSKSSGLVRNLQSHVQGNKTNAARVEMSSKQRAKDLERLKLLGAPIDSLNFGSSAFDGVASKKVTAEEAKEQAKAILDQLKIKKTESSNLESPKINESSYNSAPIQFEHKITTLLENNVEDISKPISKTPLQRKREMETLGRSSSIAETISTPKITATSSQNKSEEDISKELKSSTLNSQLNKKRITEALPVTSVQKRLEQSSNTPEPKPVPIKTATSSQNQREEDFSKELKSTVTSTSQLNKKRISEALPLTSFQKRLEQSSNTPEPKPVPTITKPSEIIKDFKQSIPKLTPTLSKTTGLIDLSASPKLSNRLMNRGRLNALKYVQQKGPIEKVDPMNLKGNPNKKRLLNQIESPEIKRSKPEPLTTKSAKFKEIMEAKSMNQHLIEQCDNEAEEKYFNTLEAKERMEEKMANTFKVACKAVVCLKCKYTSFSASNLCKTERHPLKVLDATKRFFKCESCSNRITSLEIFPLVECSKCGSMKWVRAAMIKERVVQVKDNLSIRGGEEKYVGCYVADANLNLLVPE